MFLNFGKLEYYVTGFFGNERISFIESEDAYSKGSYFLFIEFDEVDIDYSVCVISAGDTKIKNCVELSNDSSKNWDILFLILL